MTVLLVLAAFAASAILAGLVRRYAIAHAVVDIPNERSSHSSPTPRGGGLAIAAVALIGIVALSAAGQLSPRAAIALGGGGLVVAAVGWVDDRRDLPAWPRLAAHVGAAVWLVAWLGGMPSLTVGAEAVPLGFFGSLLAVLGVTWFTNLYNFMDGIDGIAAVEAVVAGTAGGLLLAARQSSLGLVSLLLAAGAAGAALAPVAPMWLLLVAVVLVGTGYAGCQVFPLAMLPDAAAVDARDTGSNRAGVYTGVWTAGETLGLALGPGVFALVLAIGGYRSSTTGDVVQPDSAVTAIVLGFSVLPAVLTLVSLRWLVRYSLDAQEVDHE
jgi:hypothetical protein